MQATLNKGAKAVGGFTSAVRADYAQDFCGFFLTLLGTNADYNLTWDYDIDEFSLSFKDAFDKATIYR